MDTHRSKMGRVAALLVVLLSLALVGSTRAGAQDASPVASPDESLGGPAGCQVEPRPLDELMALWYQADAAGTPAQATPEPPPGMFPTEVPAPLGEPADARTVAGVTAAAWEVMACSNAQDVRRWLALFDDALAQQAGLWFGFASPEEARAFLEAPRPPRPTDQYVRLLAVSDVSVMADGRVGALIVFDDPTDPEPGTETELVFFVEEGGRWLADGIVEFTVVEDGDDGTPAP